MTLAKRHAKLNIYFGAFKKCVIDIRKLTYAKMRFKVQLCDKGALLAKMQSCICILRFGKNRYGENIELYFPKLHVAG